LDYLPKKEGHHNDLPPVLVPLLTAETRACFLYRMYTKKVQRSKAQQPPVQLSYHQGCCAAGRNDTEKIFSEILCYRHFRGTTQQQKTGSRICDDRNHFSAKIRVFGHLVMPTPLNRKASDPFGTRHGSDNVPLLHG